MERKKVTNRLKPTNNGSDSNPPPPFGRMQSGEGGWQHQNKASISAARNQASSNDHVNKKLLDDILLDTHTNTHTFKEEEM